ncbi:Uncharacterised protein [Yersinia pseudotuberculosis]|nr:Uncharacterised protein [Yersinia pseudotuberculosis]CRY73377.1 Uncharacterised protein [Yersinia pseudotuberculosis]
MMWKSDDVGWGEIAHLFNNKDNYIYNALVAAPGGYWDVSPFQRVGG